MRRAVMWWLLLASATAHAERGYSQLGMGAGAGVDGEPTLVLQGELYSQDADSGDRDGMLIALHAGARYWRVPETRWGVDVPLGLAFGVHSGPVQTTLGAGMGLAALEFSGRDTGFGITPFANTRFGVSLNSEWLASVDLRATREVLAGLADRTTFDVVVLLGKHSHF